MVRVDGNVGVRWRTQVTTDEGVRHRPHRARRTDSIQAQAVGRVPRRRRATCGADDDGNDDDEERRTTATGP
jgi:hypothetical protein